MECLHPRNGRDQYRTGARTRNHRSFARVRWLRLSSVRMSTGARAPMSVVGAVCCPMPRSPLDMHASFGVRQFRGTTDIPSSAAAGTSSALADVQLSMLTSECKRGVASQRASSADLAIAYTPPVVTSQHSVASGQIYLMLLPSSQRKR
jgi:hypothetical protein